MNPKQQQILEAAIQCVHEVGIEKTNAKLIAERLDMPTSLIFTAAPSLLPFVCLCTVVILTLL